MPAAGERNARTPWRTEGAAPATASRRLLQPCVRLNEEDTLFGERQMQAGPLRQMPSLHPMECQSA